VSEQQGKSEDSKVGRDAPGHQEEKDANTGGASPPAAEFEEYGKVVTHYCRCPGT
jgi:hypothetical protein